jgi:hypothetical protein
MTPLLPDLLVEVRKGRGSTRTPVESANLEKQLYEHYFSLGLDAWAKLAFPTWA